MKKRNKILVIFLVSVAIVVIACLTLSSLGLFAYSELQIMELNQLGTQGAFLNIMETQVAGIGLLRTQAANNPQDQEPSPDQDFPTLTATPFPAGTPKPTLQKTSNPIDKLPPGKWQEWPVFPKVNTSVKEIYKKGLQMGNDPHAFSIIGDCMNYPYLFMGIFDSDKYKLRRGHEYLQETIDNFKGSYSHHSMTVKNGMDPPKVLSPVWADANVCSPTESPLECELRLHKPSIIIINLGTNWVPAYKNSYDDYMRQIVDILLARGVIPILSTKADNQEGDNSVNRGIARVAYDYDLPMWNFWASAQDLLFGGLDPDHNYIYLSAEGYTMHSTGGLMALDTVWRQLNE